MHAAGDKRSVGCHCGTIAFLPDDKMTQAQGALSSAGFHHGPGPIMNSVSCRPGGQDPFCQPFVGHPEGPSVSLPTLTFLPPKTAHTRTGPHGLGRTGTGTQTDSGVRNCQVK